MDGQGWFRCSNGPIIVLSDNETTICSDSRAWDEWDKTVSFLNESIYSETSETLWRGALYLC